MLPRLNDEHQNPVRGASAPWVVLIGLCTVVFAASAALCVPESEAPWWEMAWGMQCPAALRTVGAADLARLWDEGGWWRVLTTGFAHGSALHLTLNMWSLWVVGPWASRAWGHVAAMACYVVSSVGGVLASIAWAEAPVVVGASAGILGLAGGLWVSRGWGSAEVRERVSLVSTRGLGITLGFMVGLGFVVPMIAQAGHLGGLAFGLLAGVGFARVGPNWARPAAAVACAAGLVGAGVLAQAPEGRANYFAFRGYALLEAGQGASAIPLLETALEREESPGLQNGVAYALAEAGIELDRAEALVELALESDAGNSDYLDTKGWILCRRGKVEEGLKWIEKASVASDGAVEEIEEHLQSCSEAVFHVER
jgi:membrane associated rhomboid family serine protease